MFEELGISSVHCVIIEFVGRYGLEWVQSQSGRAEMGMEDAQKHRPGFMSQISPITSKNPTQT